MISVKILVFLIGEILSTLNGVPQVHQLQNIYRSKKSSDLDERKSEP